MKEIQSRRVLDAVVEIDGLETQEEIIKEFSDIVESYGFGSWAISQMANPARIPLTDRIAITTWPEEYSRLREDNPEEVHDPIVRQAARVNRPFRWGEALQQADAKGRSMMDLARDFGLTDGLVIPIKSIDRLPGGVSLAGDTSNLTNRQIRELHLVAVHTYDRLEALIGYEPFRVSVNLSPREREIMHWIAAGKTCRDIADILDLKPKTVEHYTASARRKLDASTMAQAISTAIGLGLVLP